MRHLLLLWLSCLFPLLISPAEAAGKTQPDRIYPVREIAEACDRAERENLPVCFSYLAQYPPENVPQGLERVWKEAVNLLSGECVVIVCRQPENGSHEFPNLTLRTSAASLDFKFTGVKLLDAWQETKLGQADISYFDTNDPDKKKKVLPVFSKNVEQLVKAASDWKAGRALKPEVWTDAKDRVMTATAVSWDGKTAVFRLSAGKSVNLPAATLSADSQQRLGKAFALKLPFVNASDLKDLESHLGQEVCVVGREERVNPTFGREGPLAQEVYLLYFSRLFAIKFDKSLEDQFKKNNPGRYHTGRGRAYGVIEKETDPKATQQYFIRVTTARQFGPGAVAP